MQCEGEEVGEAEHHGEAGGQVPVQYEEPDDL